jgi:hypothetical protein
MQFSSPSYFRMLSSSLCFLTLHFYRAIISITSIKKQIDILSYFLLHFLRLIRRRLLHFDTLTMRVADLSGRAV